MADEVSGGGASIAGHDHAVRVPDRHNGRAVGDLGDVERPGRLEGAVTEPVEESEEVGTRVVAGNEEGKRHVPEANPPPTTGYSPPFWM